MSKNIGYHTRLYLNHTVKVTGGSFGGSIDTETVQRLVNSHFTCVVKPSGTVVFVDKSGREVTLYLTVDPSTTEQGKKALQEYLRQWEALQKQQEEKENAIKDLICSIGVDEALRLLTKGK